MKDRDARSARGGALIARRFWTSAIVRTVSALVSAARAGEDGQLVYAANGRLSVQIVRTGRTAAAVADGFSSYFGRWQLVPTEGYVIHYQDGNLALAQMGQAAKRYYSFDADGHLSLATPPSKRDDGRSLSSVFVWEKMP